MTNFLKRSIAMTRAVGIEVTAATNTTSTNSADAIMRKPVLLKFRSDKSFIIFTVAIAIFTDIFLYGLIVPVFPFALEDRANIKHDDVQYWVSVLLAVYGAGLLMASPVFGYIADHTSTRRSPLLLGLFALAGATVMLCMGFHIIILVIGRLLQGIAAAVVWTVGLALLVDTVGKEELGHSMGIVSLAMTAGIFLAPLLGGVVYERGGYYAVFSMAFAMIGIDIILRLLLIEKKVAQKYLASSEAPGEEMGISPSRECDGGTCSHGACEAGETPGVRQEVETSGSPTTDDVGPGATTVSSTRAQSRSFIRNLPPVITLLRYPRLITALWATLVEATLMTSLETTMPLYAREVFHFGPTSAGLLFLAVILPCFCAPVVGRFTDKYGPRWIATFGFILACPFLALLRYPGDNSARNIVLMCALLFFIGIALTLTMPPVMTEITLVLSDLEREKPGMFGANGAYAQAYGLFNVAYSGGTLIGPLWSGFVKSSAGWGTMAWSLAMLSVVTSIPTVVYTGGKINRENWKFSNKAIGTSRVLP